MVSARILAPLISSLSVFLGVSPAFPQSPAPEPATYRMEAEFAWTAQDFPLAFPDDPHFSRFIGMTHNGKYRLFADGETASSGLGLVATNGRVSILQAELGEATRRKRVGEIVEADGLKTGTGTVAMTFTLTASHPLFSFVTMVAPSPDWITGAADVAFLHDGTWTDRIEIPLWVWDAGVDSGTRFEAADAPVQPRESVRLSAAPYFLYPSGLKPIGRAVFTKMN